VSVGQAAGSAATKRAFDPARRNGNAIPAKFEPPPTQPTMTSGSSPASCICRIASWPITVWCRSTWLSTDPSEYLQSGSWAATSTASEIAIPSEPVVCSAWPRPDCVRSDGERCTVAPQASIIERRYGFWS
jgi:hypothetical protein